MKSGKLVDFNKRKNIFWGLVPLLKAEDLVCDFIMLFLFCKSHSLEISQNFHRDFTVVFVWFSKIPQHVKKPNVVILWLFGLSKK